jgi:hypothetical protein
MESLLDDVAIVIIRERKKSYVLSPFIAEMTDPVVGAGTARVTRGPICTHLLKSNLPPHYVVHDFECRVRVRVRFIKVY